MSNFEQPLFVSRESEVITTKELTLKLTILRDALINYWYRDAPKDYLTAKLHVENMLVAEWIRISQPNSNETLPIDSEQALIGKVAAEMAANEETSEDPIWLDRAAIAVQALRGQT